VYHGRKKTGSECHVPATIHKVNSLERQQANKHTAGQAANKVSNRRRKPKQHDVYGLPQTCLCKA
jgi:hypothetical protein